MVPNFEMKQLASQKMLKYSVSDALSTQMEKDIDDLTNNRTSQHTTEGGNSEYTSRCYLPKCRCRFIDSNSSYWTFGI
jgi:hypothetical protein